MVDVEAMVETVAQEMHPEHWEVVSVEGQANAIAKARVCVSKILGMLPAATIEWSLQSDKLPGKWPVFVTRCEAQKFAVGSPANVVMRAVTHWTQPSLLTENSLN